MNLPEQTFVNVSGIDRNKGATIVFAWCRNRGPEDFVLLGSGHVVPAFGNDLPPGILAGQYKVTFLMPPGCSVGDVFVTDDTSGRERLSGVTVTPCLIHPGSQSDDPVSGPDAHRARPLIGPSAVNATTSFGRG